LEKPEQLLVICIYCHLENLGLHKNRENQPYD
jgi:hypothetical protein